MTITKTIDVPDDYRITLDIPRECPKGPVILTFTPARAEAKPARHRMTEAEEIEHINRNADRLNAEAMDVLRYQNMYIDEILDKEE